MAEADEQVRPDANCVGRKSPQRAVVASKRSRQGLLGHACQSIPGGNLPAEDTGQTHTGQPANLRFEDTRS